MGKFDIDAQQINESKLTLNELSKEIYDESDTPFSCAEIMFKLKNKQGSGLINKLKKHLNFDIEGMAEVSISERFNALKLLKELFFIEKDGSPKYVNDYDLKANTRVHIIDILAKPRLANIKTYYAYGSQYGDVFDQLFADISSNVSDADERIGTIEDIDSYWQYIAQKQFDYVFSNMALADMESSLKELQRINRVLENVLNKLDINERNLKMSTEGVMKTFFNILLTHQKLCNETDRIKAAEYIDIDMHPNTEYTELFRRFEFKTLNTSEVSIIKKYIDFKNKPEEINDVFDLISYCEEIPKEDYRHYKYAFDHVQTVLNMMSKEKGKDYSKEVYLVLFVSVIQEIVYVKKNSDKLVIRNDYYGYNAKGTTLMSALKKQEDEVDSILVHIWIRRVETRFSINYGAHDLIVEKNKAELLTFKIKVFLYGYRNLNELKKANAYIAHMIGIAHTNTCIAAKGEFFFQLWLAHHLDSYGITIDQFVLPDDPQNIYDMFREFLSVFNHEVNIYINEFAEQVVKTIIINDTSKTITHAFKINKYDGSFRKYYFNFKCDEIGKKFIYKKFGLIYSDEEKENIKRLGIKKLIL